MVGNASGTSLRVAIENPSHFVPLEVDGVAQQLVVGARLDRAHVAMGFTFSQDIFIEDDPRRILSRHALVSLHGLSAVQLGLALRASAGKNPLDDTLLSCLKWEMCSSRGFRSYFRA